MYTFECKNCGKVFKSYAKNRKFCSPSCSSIYNNKKRKGFRDINLICDYCNKEFSIKRGNLNKLKRRGFTKHYCSRQCSANDKKGTTRPNTSESLVKAYAEGRIIQKKYRKGGFRKDLNKYFRSNWEANYARILNYSNKTWEYEPRTFILTINSKTTTYTPDFFISDDNKWVEIKGYWYNELSKCKYDKFAETHNIELIDLPKYVTLQEKYKDKVLWEGKKYDYK